MHRNLITKNLRDSRWESYRQVSEAIDHDHRYKTIKFIQNKQNSFWKNKFISMSSMSSNLVKLTVTAVRPTMPIRMFLQLELT